MKSGRIVQINVKPLTGEEAGLPKRPVESAQLTAAGFVGDYNRYRQEKKAGSPDMAVLVMPIETLRELEQEGWPVRPGDIGENITSAGIAYADFSPGSKFKIGSAQIQISEPCTPCRTLGRLPYVGPAKTARFIKTMLGRRGWYARVLEEGHVRAGDAIERL